MVDFFDGDHSYYGGRTEVFQLGKCRGLVYDINSMYPYAMKLAEFPNLSRLIRETKPDKNWFEKHTLQNTEGVVHCQVFHYKHYFGHLPYRAENRKLIFPTGSFSGWWNFNELRYAVNACVVEIKEIYEIVYSRKPMKSPFISYIDELYTRRMKTDDWFEKFRVKVFMVSLYGKFGENITEELVYMDDVHSDENMKIRYDLMREGKTASCQMFSVDRDDGWLIIEKDKKSQAPHAIPLFASYITSYARVELLKYLTTYEENKVLYCDTDSLFVEKPLPLENSKELGALKLEEKIITDIKNLKDYAYIDEENIKQYALKGVPKKAREIAPNIFEFWDMIKTKESLVRQIPAGSPVLRKKHVKSTYDKREILNFGSTKPIQL